MNKHYVEFFYPGSLFAETSIQQVVSREAKVDFPKGIYGYRFFMRDEFDTETETLVGKPHNHSVMTYFGEEYYCFTNRRRFDRQG